jgi:hypothetical protein
MDYSELRKIDVSEHIEKKNGLSYLSWAWAVDTLLQKDPDAKWDYPEPWILTDGTMMVYCVVTAFGKYRQAHLPVMDYKNQAIKNPNAFQINTAMQRCLVKAIAMHGIGLYVYAGEDLPDNGSAIADTPTERTTDKPEPNTGITEEHKKFQRDCLYDTLVAKNDADLDQIIEQNTHAFGELPDIINGQITDTISSRRKQIAGNIHPKPEWGFINVGEAVEFATKAKELIDDTNLDNSDLKEWFHENSHKIGALDKTLTAAKYKKDNKEMSERLKQLYEERINK